jgi:NADPH2:quinone reductase
MKAVCIHQFGGPEVLQYEEVPTPTPGPGQVLVKLAAAGLNLSGKNMQTSLFIKI